MLLDTFKPTFLIQIEGQTLSKDITQEITEFVFEDNEEELDVMELSITDRNLQFVDDPLFQEGNEIVARFGYVDALSLMGDVSNDNWIVFHWFLTCGTYPFFEDVAIHVGRLIKLQGQVTAKEVMERLRKTYGERETVHRCLQYVLRSMVEWSMLQDLDRGTYAAGSKTTIADGRILSWSIRCRVQGRNVVGLYESSLRQDPASFPFQFEARAWDDLIDLHASPQGRDTFYQRVIAIDSR